MPLTARRLVIAGVLTATAIAVPVAALAGNNHTTKTPTSPGRPAAAAAKPKPQGGGAVGPAQSEVAARLASRLGVSKAAAGHALQQLQQNMSRSTFAAVAHELGVSPGQLNAALREVKLSFAPPRSSSRPSGGHQKSAPQGRSLTTRPAAAAALASRLGVSMSAAQRAMHEIGVLSARDGGVDSNSPQLAAIAHDLGVSRAQLDAALRAVKESFAGQ